MRGGYIGTAIGGAAMLMDTGSAVAAAAGVATSQAVGEAVSSALSSTTDLEKPVNVVMAEHFTVRMRPGTTPLNRDLMRSIFNE